MKRRTTLFISICCFVGLCAWTATSTMDLGKAEWLIGTWENKTARGTMYESWHKANDKALKGKSYRVSGKDTMVFEQLQLVQEEGRLVYIPIVNGQNNGMPVRFPAKAISTTQLLFENPQHDFPQTISYTKISADSLVAEISGLRNGQQRKQTFKMRRVK